VRFDVSKAAAARFCPHSEVTLTTPADPFASETENPRSWEQSPPSKASEITKKREIGTPAYPLLFDFDF